MGGWIRIGRVEIYRSPLELKAWPVGRFTVCLPTPISYEKGRCGCCLVSVLSLGITYLGKDCRSTQGGFFQVTSYPKNKQ